MTSALGLWGMGCEATEPKLKRRRANMVPKLEQRVRPLCTGLGRALRETGIGTIAIMPNDTDTYPEDSFDNMKAFAARHRLLLPLRD